MNLVSDNLKLSGIMISVETCINDASGDESEHENLTKSKFLNQSKY